MSTVLLAVGGGIAAYKSADIASRLSKAGHEVHGILSEAAGHFIRPLTFAAITGNPAVSNMFPDPSKASGEDAYPHLYPAARADLFLLAPATADMIAKLAHGFGSDLVSTCALSLPAGCLKCFAPAMNTEMWNQPVVQENVRKLEALGWLRMGPEAGLLACGAEGLGRMMEPQALVERVLARLGQGSTLPLLNRHVLILSGPTREKLDPVRYISNPSSGKMGRALAEQAVFLGATVDFVSGPVSDEHLPVDHAIRVYSVTSADEMLATASSRVIDADILIFAAAVSDYRPASIASQKLPKTNESFALNLVPTPDIAATLCLEKRPNQVSLGFALQTGDGIAKAQAKLRRKHLDGILLNSPEALGGDEGTYTWISGQDGETIDAWGTLPKRSCAEKLLRWAADQLVRNTPVST